MLRTICGAALALFVLMTLLAPERVLARDKTDQLRVVYGPVNPEHENLRQTLKQMQVFETLRKIVSPLRLPRKLPLEIEECNGDTNAFYEGGIIKICYDYLDFIWQNAAKTPAAMNITPKAAFIGATVDLVLHEVGHAVFEMLKIPVLGREEDAADMFSAYIMLQFAPADAHNLIVATAFLGATEAQAKPTPLKAFADEHGLPAQRYFNLLCIAYGAAPKTFSHVLTISHLTKERAE